MQSACPQDAELRRLASGELPKEAVETLAAHLETCASCLAKVQTLAPADTLSRALPLARKASAIGDTGEVSGLIGKLKSLSVAPADLLCACGTCGKKLKVKANLAGKKVKCPGCGGIVAVAKSAPAPGPGSSGVEERTLPPDRAIRSEDRTVAPETKGALTGLHSTPSEHTAGLEKEGDSEAWDFLAPAQEADEIGRLGGYRILKVLGRGGMGVVFRAEDPNLKRIVALKAMLPSLAASPSSKKRFIREAQTAASIKHDHIVTIHQVGEDQGAPFLAMEFLHGEPLDVRLKRESRLPVSEVLRIGRETAEGLAAAHEAGLIHRDIKPGNVWLESMKRKAQGSQSAGAPRVKILDFGLARATDDTTGLTQSGAIIGTPAYMAPEQANGGAVDHRCDLFSLGCMLYSMTTGQMPFAGKDTMSILMAIAMNDPKPPIELRSDMPIELSDLIVRLLSKKPEDRPADALEVAETLRRIETTARADDATGITTAPVPKKRGAASTRVAPGADVSGSPRRRRGILIGAALALVLAAVVAAGIVLFLPAGNGTIRVEINDPDIEVALTAKGIKIKGADKQGDIVVTPGEHSLKVSRGELFFDTDKIVLKKGEVVTVKVEWLKDKLVAARADTGAPLGAKGTTPVGPPSVPGGDLALQFEGPGRVEIASLKIPTDGPYTLEGYFFPEPAKIGGVDNYAMGVPFQSHLSYTRNGDWRWVASKTAETKSSIAAIPARPQVQHIACVCDGKLRRIYVDGKFVKQAPAAEVYANRPFELGGSFHGTIDEVRVSKVARYRGEFTPQKRFEPDADTLALYHFDEGEGDVLKDSSGNGHHGKITGAKWVKGDAPSPQSSSGVVRHGLQFDGKRSHVIIDRLGRSNNEPRTIEAYLIPATVSIESNKGANVIGYRGPAGMLNIMQMKDSWKGHAVRALKKKSDATFVTGVPGQVRVGVRVHVATIWDGTECRLFVDGKRVLVENEIGIPQFFGTFNATILAASASEPIDRFWAGVMTEVRISKGVRYDKNFSPAERFEPDIDTLALYHFDEGEGDVLKDSSGNGYHGKIVGAKWVKVDYSELPIASARSGLRFRDDEVVTIPGLKIDANDAVTMEAYVLCEGWPPFEKQAPIVVGFHRGTALYFADPKEVRFAVATADNVIHRAISPPVVLGRYQHLAGVRDGNKLRLYIDGKLVAQGQTSNLPLRVSSEPAAIGGRINAVISEVRVSRGARYDKDFTPQNRFEPDIDTLALYHFDEGEGDVLKDSSGNGHHGRIVGAKWVKIEEATIATVPAVTDADRLAFLDWFYQQQAMNQRIDIEQDGKTFWLKGKRPTGPFLIRRVQLGGGKKSLPDEFAARFAAFPEIQDLHVSIASLEALTHLAPLKDLRRLNLDKSPIPAEGAKIVRGFTKLEHLRVPKPTDEWLKGLAGMPSLRSFYFYRQPVTESELAKLKDFPSLVQVKINDCRLTEAGLLKLKEAKALRLLVLQKVGIDDPEAFKRLAAALPECEIHHVVFNEPTAIYNKGKAEGLTLAPDASDDDGPP